MSVAKSGSDDRNCGYTNKDAMHKAICRLVAAGVTVIAAAGNNSFSASRLIPASYNEVITVSALADTDGIAGGTGGNSCKSWGSYDSDDTYANFSNYGADVDLIAPGKCIWSTAARQPLRLFVGDLDGGAARDRRRGPVAEHAPRPHAGPGEGRAPGRGDPRLADVLRPGRDAGPAAQRRAPRERRRLPAGRRPRRGLDQHRRAHGERPGRGIPCRGRLGGPVDHRPGQRARDGQRSPTRRSRTRIGRPGRRSPCRRTPRRARTTSSSGRATGPEPARSRCA